MKIKIIVFSLFIIFIFGRLAAEESVFGNSFLYEEEQYAYCKKFLADGKYEKAITGYRQLLTDYPKSAYKSEIYFMIGYTYNNSLNDTAKAGETYRYLIKNFPKSEFAPSAQFELEHLGQPDFLPEFDNTKE